MKKTNFEQLICEAINALPTHAKVAMENVVFVISAKGGSASGGEEKVRRPPSLKLQRAGKKANEVSLRVDEVLLGLYEGIPKIKRGANYFGVLPDKITIFQQPIEELAGHDDNRLKKLIYEVVWHEVGHHLGFDESEIRALEAKQIKQKDFI